MDRARRQFYAICLVAFVHWFSFQGLGPLVPLHAASLGMPAPTIGAIVAAAPLLPVFLSIPAGAAADAWGRRTVLIWGMVGMALAGAALIPARSAAALLVIQALLGGFQGLTWITAQTVVTELSVGDRLRRLSVLSIFGTFGTLAGPVVGGLVADAWGYPAAFAVATAVATAGVAAAAGLRDLDRAPAGRSLAPVSEFARGLALLRRPGIRVGLGFSFVLLAVMSLLRSFYPVYLQLQGYTATQIGLLLGVNAVAATLGLPAVAPLVTRFGRYRALVGAMTAAVAAVSATPLLRGFGQLAVAAAVGGFGHSFNHPLGILIVAEHSSVRERGVALGLRIMSNRLAMLLAPLLFGAVAGVARFPAAFAATGAVLLGLVALLAGAARNRAALYPPPDRPPGDVQD